ncbi:DUF1919 domain-containing protein [Acidiphilium acidophilum]|uniref:DUF1919 domain-containing protein n=1 Tax=Acidiphilium acidophilum TaxID=76588 RepID=A0AAW9DQP4_ACIAO|nr:DUF1919 domain-containing protein [Acidiphilium acidophilum]MDX5930545.1 DUF1919 domain-containing protein [Acidiphilium acidophilum]
MNSFDLNKTCIISNNCWGSGFYKDQNVRYNTPFVGLYMQADDYIDFLSNFRKNLTMPISMSFASRYGSMPFPVGRISDSIEILFMHYQSCDEAYDKWSRRVARVPNDDENLLIKICDRDGFTDEHIPRFERLDFSYKVGFLKKGRFSIFDKNIFHEIDVNNNEDCCPSGTELFEITKYYFRENA